MHALQGYNKVGDLGACGLGEGLKVNNTLQMLNLVSDLFLLLFLLLFLKISC